MRIRPRTDQQGEIHRHNRMMNREDTFQTQLVLPRGELAVAVKDTHEHSPRIQARQAREAL